MPRPQPDNREIAEVLERVADLLEAQDANPFRVRAYRTAAGTLRGLAEPAAGILAREGPEGLDRLPGIGPSIARLVAEFVHTLRLSLLERLEGQVSPEDLFTTVPGIGDELAARIHGQLGVETLEELELAAHDGRLQTVAGMGERRVRAVREALDAMLRRTTRRRARLVGPRRARSPRPDVALLLAIDREYRELGAAGRLHTIAPRRFNPRHESWLPVWHVHRDGWDFDVMFSNTARAHELGRTREWVVIYWARNGDEGQCTVVTEHRGPQTGARVVRGRELESAGPPAKRGPPRQQAGAAALGRRRPASHAP